MTKKQSAIDKLLGRNKPQPEIIHTKSLPSASRQYMPDEVNEYGEYIKIGGSPVPGITLRQILRGHTGRINRIAWSPNGRYLASPSHDKTIRIWDFELGESFIEVKGHDGEVWCVAWSPDSQFLASGSRDTTVRIWDVAASQQRLVLGKHTDTVKCLAWSPDGRLLASGSNDHTVQIWNIENHTPSHTFSEHPNFVNSLAWSLDGNILATGSDPKIWLWNLEARQLVSQLEGHNGAVNNLVWNHNENLITSTGSIDHIIIIWKMPEGAKTRILEGHTRDVTGLSYTSDHRVLATKSNDGTFRMWETDTWESLAVIKETMSQSNQSSSLAFHPSRNLLATLGENDSIIRVWDIDYDTLIGNTPVSESVRYTTAKLVLVGDSGVGKTGLGWRLSHNEFKEHSSTHGQQFWVVPELKKTREDGTECEAVLWDLAGQHIYRSIHSIFLDDVDASLVLFDPTNRQEPLKGAQFWLEQLKGKKQLPPSVLVGARLDRGAPVLSQQELERFCQRHGISGGYIGTSAKSGEGLDTLLRTLSDQIPWDQMTTTVTTVTFKRIKEFVLSLKEKPDRKGVLVRPDELRKQLETTDKEWQFTDAEMMTAVRHLANHGYVTILHSSSGEEFILLIPELLASVASSIFLHADKNPRELGAINETELLQGKYPIEEFKGLEKEEQQVLLDATVVRFLEHSLCFREVFGFDNLLIFPSLTKIKRPLRDDIPYTEDISYIVRGRVENIYATLVVLLGYTSSFTRINQWQNQVQYETEDGNICGFRLVEDREGELEFILYYSNGMSVQEREDFQALFEQFLYQRDVDVSTFPPVICPNGHQQERATIIKRLKEGKKFVHCEECGASINLTLTEPEQSSAFEVSDWLKREEALARLRNTYESHLARVKAYRRNWAVPRCYISHAPEQKEFADRLERDLVTAGILVIADPSKVETSDKIIIVESGDYKKAWDTVLKADGVIIKPRLSDPKRNGLISINQDGNAVGHNIKQCPSNSFNDPTHYLANLFDLVLNLFAIQFNQAGFGPLRQSLHAQWEQTLAPIDKTEKQGFAGSPARKEIYVSYKWRGDSEKIVNEIDSSFQNRGITIIRDKRDLGYKGSIQEFMKRIGRGKCVVVVISDQYLKSKNCMFELIEIAKNDKFKNRIFPVVLGDADIYDGVKRLGYVKFWENKKEELDKAMKEVGSEKLHGIREEIDQYDTIRDEIAKLTDILQDMNTLTPDIHRDNDFQILFDDVTAKLEE